jgi:AcrR family transcriptional regulator
MAQRGSGLKADGGTPPADEVPDWQKRSVERSLEQARLRARARSDRFVNAALDLLAEREDTDITVQDVVDRAMMSIRTFYAFFDGKDSLLLAVYETIMTKTVVPTLRERCTAPADPVMRVRALLDALFELNAMPGRLARALSVFHYRLAETQPDNLRHALIPLHSLVTELMTGVAEAERLRTDLPLATVVELLEEVLLATTHAAVFAGGKPPTKPDDLWAFCSAAILRSS